VTTPEGRRAPAALEHLLQAQSGPGAERAWAGFLDEYSRLILHVARSFGGSHDDAMDRYAYCLDQLQRDDFRRVREYSTSGRGAFTTWLVVLLRRACLDQVRGRYGRQRGGSSEAHVQRRQLADLVAADVDASTLPADAASPDDAVRQRELLENLTEALEQLDPADRLILRLRFHDEASAAEIARICDLPSVFHVYRQLNSVYARLRRSLSELGVRDSAP
jgi:RNA polymerase sigma factor (sigma-70 family)